MDIYAACFLDGRLPWPPDAVPRPVADAFNNFRNRRNKELERHVFQILEDAGIPFKNNIEPHHAAPSGLQLTGEIDALAGDPARSRLWVCEVKDVSAAPSRTRSASSPIPTADTSASCSGPSPKSGPALARQHASSAYPIRTASGQCCP
jgi:hypothetical protein